MSDNILVYAFRYAFGRTSLAPLVVAKNIEALIPTMTLYDKKRWIKRLEDAARDQPIGWDCDYDTWAGLYEELMQSAGVENPKPLRRKPSNKRKTSG